jgi:exonuclease SbcC
MIKNLLNPKWQHPDAGIRRQAIEEGRLKDDILFELAKSDPDSGVRALAVSRLQDLQQLITLAETGVEITDAGVPARIHELLLAADPDTEPDRQILQRCDELCSDEKLRRSLMLNAPYAALRQMMVKGVQQEDALQESAINDRSGDVRRAAVTQIHNEDILRQISRQLRGNDKTTARLAEEKRAQLQQQRETGELQRRLLTELGAFADGSKTPDPAAIDKLTSEWNSVAGNADKQVLDRFNALQAELQPRLEQHRLQLEREREGRSLREGILQALSELAQQCPELEPDESAQRLNANQASWKALGPLQNTGAQQHMDQDFEEAVNRVRDIIDRKRRQADVQLRIDTVISSLEARLQAETLSGRDVSHARKQNDDLVHSIKDRASFDKPLQRVRNLVEKLDKKLADQQEEEKSLHVKLKTHIEKLETSLQEKALRPALAAHKKAHDALVAAGNPLPGSFRSLEKRLHHCEPVLRELKSWRNWGTDHVREELINEALALCEAPPGNVEKLAKKLTDLRSRWKELGPLEPGAKAQWEKFDEACTRAHEPVKAKHDTDAKTRRDNLEQRKAICQRLEDLVRDTEWEEQPDWHALDKAMGEARRHWNKTGGVPHKAWSAVRKRFDAAIKDLDHHLAPERERNFGFRERLVHQAEQLAQEEDNRAATAAARELRKQWQVSVHSHNRKEKKLWQAFNKAMDQVFQKDRAARDQFKASLDENQHKAEQICEQLEKQSKADNQTIRSQHPDIQQAVEQFSALNLPRKTRKQLEGRFDKARKALKQRIHSADDALKQEQLEQLFALHRLCTQLETLALDPEPDSKAVSDIEAEWSEAAKPTREKAALHRIEQRYRAALAVVSNDKAADTLGDLAKNADRKRALCTDLEILLHLESPESERGQRMQRQVELMESAMKGMHQDSPDSIRELRLSYLTTGPAEPALQSELEERFEKLLNPTA